MVETAKIIWADGPTSTPHEPDKAQIRAWGSWLENLTAALNLSVTATYIRGTKAQLDAVSGATTGQVGIVVADDDVSLRGVYVRQGSSWVKKLDLPADAAQAAADVAEGARDIAIDARDIALAAQEAAEDARDIAAGYASDAVSQGNVPVYATKAGMGALTVPAGINAVRVNGQAAAGDGLGGLYIDTNNGSSDTFTSNGGTRTWYLAADVSEKRLTSTVIDLINGLAATAVATANNKKTSASIKHVRDGTYIYDVITVKNPSPKLVRQEFAPGVAADGVVTRVTCQQYAKATGAQVVVNASGFRAPDGGDYTTSPQARPMGLSIANNILYQDWLPAETRTQAIVMGKDGKLVEANKGDGISGAQWVAAGAEWAVCFGVTCVRNGAAVNVDASYIGTAISARTVIGQKANGDILIITVEGSTGVYGASGTQCGVIAQSLGCTIAYVCDGGGSTQAWWRDCYSIPTSDATERALPNFFVIDADMIGEYDTGWVSLPLEAGLSAQVASLPGLAFRQVNETIHLQVNVAAAATFTTTATVLHTNDFPVRFQPFIVGLGRGFVSGPSGNAGSVFMGAKLSGKAQTGTLTYISGVISWPAKYAGLPAQAT